ncbi:hypothetical protein [Asticcacaulis sp. 201]|uniref:hypothetical protein n=1 Tax=Asticcacaulis sp. 201 TaxID=3028787 RepID=UPI00291692BF|nr:hypothetical protein [Asticcacaulis sp. 201]MDV6332389.1 hypothetical protein [Asticcacaulis sp. 201]
MPADVGQVCAQRHGNGIALAALLATAIAGILLFVQITQTERHEAERLRKTHLASRAALPVLLAEIYDFTDDLRESLRSVFGSTVSNVVDKSVATLKLPRGRPSIVDGLQKAIESSTRRDIQDRLADIISTYQLCYSRLRGLKASLSSPNTVVLHSDLIKHVIEIASLRALAGTMYRYVRRETERMEPYDFQALQLELGSLYFTDPTGLGDDIDGRNYKAATAEISRRQVAGMDAYIFKRANERA